MGLFSSGSKEIAKAQAAVNDAIEQSIKKLEMIGVPSIEAQQLFFENPQLVYQFVPELERIVPQSETALKTIQVDERLKQAQDKALSELSLRAEGGLTTDDIDTLNTLKRESENQKTAQFQTAFQQASQRGKGTSEYQVQQQLAAQQQANQLAAQQAEQQSVQDYQTRMQALENVGQLGTQLRNQEFQEESAKAKAQDVINQFNLENKQSLQSRNIAAQNAAAQKQQALKQQLASEKAELANQQQIYNKSLIQKNYQDELNRAALKAGLYQNQGTTAAQMAAANAQNIAAKYGAIAGLGGAMMSAGGAMAASDQRVKKDIRPFDSSEFLDNLKAFLFQYKNPEKYGYGEQAGVMAQDVEKEVPQAVQKDIEGVKRIDFNELGGPILASLIDIHNRLQKLEK